MKTSESDPLQIADIRLSPNNGRIGLTLCPGKKDLYAATGSWDRDLRNGPRMGSPEEHHARSKSWQGG
jgi:hypothetical protein